MLGKKKLFIGLAIFFGLAVWPFTLGVLISWLIYKKIGNKKIRYGLMVAILLPAFLINSVWTKALVSPDSYKNPPKIQSAQTAQNSSSSPTPQGEVSGVQIPQDPTPIPTTTASPKSVSVPKGMQEAKVNSVIDGDTIQVVIDSKKETLRLIGIDTPETVDPRKPVQCFGKEASAKAKSLLSGKSIRLESDPTQGERDKYQRLLRYVFLEDGTNFNKLMISEGYAHEYTYNTPYKYQAEFKQAQREAEANKVGLWADNACPTGTPQPSTQTSGTSPTTAGGFTCAGKTTCGQMASCAEAQFYLNTCGVSRLDGDKDGVPCESLCN